ncbi:MAG: hypothetical protein ACRD6W_17205, partial [Nitrososphaerales archaeon]
QPPCTPNELSVGPGGPGLLGTAGTLYLVLQVRDVGQSECSLSNDVERIQLWSSTGTPMPVVYEPNTTLDVTPSVDLLPQATAALDLAWDNWCGARGPVSIGVQVAGTGTLLPSSVDSSPLPSTPTCNGTTSPSEIHAMGWGGGPSSGDAWDGHPPSCAAPDLSASIDASQEAAGDWVITIGIVNTGDPCSVEAPVGMTLDNASGETFGVSYAGPNSEPTGGRTPQVTLTTLATTSLVVQWANWCESAPPPLGGLALILSGGSNVVWVAPALTATPSCTMAQGWNPASSSITFLGYGRTYKSGQPSPIVISN